MSRHRHSSAIPSNLCAAQWVVHFDLILLLWFGWRAYSGFIGWGNGGSWMIIVDKQLKPVQVENAQSADYGGKD